MGASSSLIITDAFSMSVSFNSGMQSISVLFYSYFIILASLGYVAKDHDAVDVGLGEYVRSNSTAPWLATYRLLSKSSPCIAEVAICMPQLGEFERLYSHVLLYPPQPAAVVDYDGRQGNFSTKMYDTHPFLRIGFFTGLIYIYI